MPAERKMQFQRRRKGLKLDPSHNANGFYGTVGSPIKMTKFNVEVPKKKQEKENASPPGAPVAAGSGSRMGTAASRAADTSMSVNSDAPTVDAGFRERLHQAQQRHQRGTDERKQETETTTKDQESSTTVPNAAVTQELPSNVATIRAPHNGRRQPPAEPVERANQGNVVPGRLDLNEAKKMGIGYFKSDWFDPDRPRVDNVGEKPVPPQNAAPAVEQKKPENDAAKAAQGGEASPVNAAVNSNANAARSYSYSSNAGSRNYNQNINFSEIQLGRMIGEGAFGKVHEGKWRGKSVAVKLLICQDLRSDILHEFQSEVEIMSVLRHPNICRLLGACMDPPHRALVVELLQRGSLWGVLRTNRRIIDFNMRCKFLYDTAKGMSYLHHFERPILHRDLKSPNLLVDKNYNIKISDFGLARVKAHVQTMTGNCGTVQWMAPEVLSNQKYTEKADVFSFGIVAWEVFTGECPYDGMAQIQVALNVLNRNHRPAIPRDCPQFFGRLMKACWNRQPDLRPSFPHIVDALRNVMNREAATGNRSRQAV